MSYTPIETILAEGHTLTPSSDLSVPLSSFSDKKAFLHLKKDKADYVISINNPMLFERNLNMAAPVGSAFADRLTDLFVATYKTSRIPLISDNGEYRNRIRVYSPHALTDMSVKMTSINTPEITDDVSKQGFLDDLVIAGEHPLDNAIVSVNGVFHRSSMFEGKRYVHDGFRTMRLTGKKDVTVVDFSALGSIETIPLTASNVTLSTKNGMAIIDAGQSLSNKTVFLVIDGYFYHLDTSVIVGMVGTKIKVAVNRLPLVSQFRHNPRTMYAVDYYGADPERQSRKYTDAYANLFIGKRFLPTATFDTVEFQRSRLTAYHSFLVVVDNPNIYLKSFPLTYNDAPGCYIEHSNRVISGIPSYGAGLSLSYYIWRDVYNRKLIYFDNPDFDMDYQETRDDSPVILARQDESRELTMIPVRLVDYFSS